MLMNACYYINFISNILSIDVSLTSNTEDMNAKDRLYIYFTNINLSINSNTKSEKKQAFSLSAFLTV